MVNPQRSSPSWPSKHKHYERLLHREVFLFAIINYMNDMTRKISLKDTDSFDAGGFSGQIYIPDESKAGYNALLVTVSGRHPKKQMVDTTRNYYVIEGHGIFVLDGVSHKVELGDLYTIAPGHDYEYQGEMKLLEFNISPDNSFTDKVLE